MICCLCGHRFEVGEVVVHVIQKRVARVRADNELVLFPERMEDGSLGKLACFSCPPRAGAPLALVGAAVGERNDV